jgi:aspartate-semialdehyde dehydrogenase
VRDGHTESVSLSLKGKPRISEVVDALRTFRGRPQELRLPTAPECPVIVREERDRPQPIRDRDAGRGMSVVVGRVREDAVLGYKYVVLGHNTIRGAAGASILNAELLVAEERI